MRFFDVHTVPATFQIAQLASPRGFHGVLCVKNEINWCNLEGDGHGLSTIRTAQPGTIDQGESIAVVGSLNVLKSLLNMMKMQP